MTSQTPVPVSASTPPEEVKRGLVIFEYFPQLKALGQSTLQQLCDDWSRTPEAHDFDVAGIDVGDASTSFAIRPRWAGRRPQPTGDAFKRFLEALFAFLNEHGLAGDEQAISRTLSARLSQPPPPESFPKAGTSRAGRPV